MKGMNICDKYILPYPGMVDWLSSHLISLIRLTKIHVTVCWKVKPNNLIAIKNGVKISIRRKEWWERSVKRQQMEEKLTFYSVENELPREGSEVNRWRRGVKSNGRRNYYRWNRCSLLHLQNEKSSENRKNWVRLTLRNKFSSAERSQNLLKSFIILIYSIQHSSWIRDFKTRTVINDYMDILGALNISHSNLNSLWKDNEKDWLPSLIRLSAICPPPSFRISFWTKIQRKENSLFSVIIPYVNA